jgi:DNA-binding beta-propeller fold protein YncE
MQATLLALMAITLFYSDAGSDPFVSRGFVQFPAEIEVGAVSAVAVDKEDNVYVLQRAKEPLLMFDKDGEFIRAWGAGLFKVPHGLRVDKEGHIWTTDNGNHVLRKFDREGKLLATLGTEGKPGSGESAFRAPDDLVFDSLGNLYVADSGNSRIVKLTADGKFLMQWGSKGQKSGQFATAHSLAIDAQDRLYVGDRGNKRIQLFDTQGKHLATWDGFGNPFGLVIVGDELLASEGDIHKIFRLSLKDGRITNSWGNPDTLKLPHLMALDSRGTLYVAEVNGKRVQKFGRE